MPKDTLTWRKSISKDDNVIDLLLYYDDVETVNQIGAFTGENGMFLLPNKAPAPEVLVITKNYQ